VERDADLYDADGKIQFDKHWEAARQALGSCKEGKIGRVYYPAPCMRTWGRQDAYEIGDEKIIDTYAAATQHVDQGLSLTLFFKDTATTRDVNKT
jgi:ribonucleotide reductase alpha subunit